METKTLYCKAGKHEWQRPAQKGRAPHSCPEHSEVKSGGGMNGLEKAQAARRKKRIEEEKEWAARIESAINDPRMQVVSNSFSPDARRTTPDKLRYIQNQLQNNRPNRSPNDVADLEKMRERIMKDPFNTGGHLY
jgi:1,6-anhydro-N-acetylmuramate kinase